jgi:hypothetical protein
MKRLGLVAVAVLALIAAPTAAAKTCIRIQAPATAEVGDTVRLVVRVYLPTWRQNRVVKLTPVTTWAGRIELAVTAPGGAVSRVRIGGARDGVGVARLALPAAGSWRFEAVGWEYAPPSCAPPRIVRVG